MTQNQKPNSCLLEAIAESLISLVKNFELAIGDTVSSFSSGENTLSTFNLPADNMSDDQDKRLKQAVSVVWRQCKRKALGEVLTHLVEEAQNDNLHLSDFYSCFLANQINPQIEISRESPEDLENWRSQQKLMQQMIQEAEQKGKELP